MRLVIVAVAFAVSVALSLIIIRAGRKLHFLQKHASSSRWHQGTVPSFGGVAIYGGLITATVVGVLARSTSIAIETWIILAAASAIFMIGFIDDIRPLPAHIKLGGHLIIAALVTWAGIHFTMTGYAWFFIPVTIVWIAGLTNAFNLVDNMDGLAGGLAFIGAGFLTLSQVLQGQSGDLTLWALMGALLGFLLFNLKPAALFMGDSGSTLLGSFLAMMAITGTWSSASNLLLMVLVPCLLFAIPIFDTVFVAINRRMHGLPVTVGGRDHTSHRLVALGLSESTAVPLLWLLALSFGLIALLAQRYSFHLWGLLVSLGLVAILLLTILLTDTKVYDLTSDSARPAKRLLRTDIWFKKRIVEVFIDVNLIICAYYLAYWLRYDGQLNNFMISQFSQTVGFVVAAKLVMFLLTQLYRGIFTYIQFNSFVPLLWANIIGSLAAMTLLLAVFRFEGFSRTLFAIDFTLTLMFMVGARIALRWLKERLQHQVHGDRRVLLVYASDTCRYLIARMLQNKHWNLQPVVVIDDQDALTDASIHHVPVIKGLNHMSALILTHRIDQVIITPPLAASQCTAIEQQCDQAGVPHYTLHPIEESLIKHIGAVK